jgi:hypothetical protein
MLVLCYTRFASQKFFCPDFGHSRCTVASLFFEALENTMVIEHGFTRLVSLAGIQILNQQSHQERNTRGRQVCIRDGKLIAASFWLLLIFIEQYP